MSEKRFRANFDVSIYDSEKEEYISVSERGLEEIAKRMNEQQDQISYWKHKVYSLLWILGQFDKAKVKELLKELDDE